MKPELRLCTEELAFFRLTLDLFPTPESPLRFLQDEDREPQDAMAVCNTLVVRKLLNAKASGAADEVIARLAPVSECNARVVLRCGSQGTDGTRDFYIGTNADGVTVAIEYQRQGDVFVFGPPQSEVELAAELGALFRAGKTARAPALALSAGDYLVFAVFARDLRSQPEPTSDDEPMSIDEVLAYFDEPETSYVRTPSDESWQRSVENLAKLGVLEKTASGFSLHPSLHAVAREIVADRQHTVMRLDFLDEQWLVREISLYPTRESVYRLGTMSDGAVVIEELSAESLAGTLRSVVATLPDMLNVGGVVPLLRSRV